MTTVITGAGRGLGRELARQMADAGALVVGTHRGPGTLGLDGVEEALLDVTAPDQHRALAERLAGRALDLLVCNAGVLLDRHEGLDSGYPAEMWAECFAVNVTGVFLTIQALLPNLRAGKGRIAIVSSQMGSTGRAGGGGSYIYRASKAAVLNLGRNLAGDLKPEGIAVGIYHPGWVQTDMGGPGASLTAAEAARGLIARFAALSLVTTGCFETWDGRQHPI